MAKEIVYPVGAGLVLDSITGSDARGFALGDTGKTKDGGDVVFVQAGNDAIGTGHLLLISPAFVATLAASAEYNLGYAVGVSYDSVSSGQYFWARVNPNGLETVRVSANTAANNQLYLSGTAGVVTSSLAAYSIFGLKTGATVTAASAGASLGANVTCVATYPRVAT